MRKVLAVTGPTASGKSSVAVAVAEKINGEIISADSRQIYRHIPIAASYPSAEELNSVKHYFIGELELEEEFNAADFGRKARETAEIIFKKGKQPVIAGGSGLYLRSFTDGLFEDDSESGEIRKMLYEKLEIYGEEFLYRELEKIDRPSALKIPKGKIRRVIRALEVYYSTGKRISELHNEKPDIKFETVQFGLLLDRKYLYKRINDRTDEMLRNGLIDEVRILKEKGYDYRICNSLNTVGVKEVYRFLEGEYDYETMRGYIKQNSRRYAKRQMTWFRKDKRIIWINADELSTPEKTANEIIKIFKKIN